MKKTTVIVLIVVFMITLASCKKEVPVLLKENDIVLINEFDFTAQYVRSDSSASMYSNNIVITSQSQLKEYANRISEDAQYVDSSPFDKAVQKYTDEFFTKKQLVVCVLEEPSGSIRHKVQKVGLGENDNLVVFIERDVPEIGTCDMALWHIIIETDKTDAKDIEIIVDGKNKTHPIDVNYNKGGIGIKLTLKPDWRFKTIERVGEYGVAIWHKDYEEKTIDILYRDMPLGLCGTGLTCDTVKIGAYTATTYRYDDMPDYFMANFDTTSGGYYIDNNGGDIWKDYEKDILEILDTIILSDIKMTKDEALKIAKQECTIDFTEEYADLDALNGQWVVVLKNSEWTQTFNVSENGHSMTATKTK